MVDSEHTLEKADDKKAYEAVVMSVGIIEEEWHYWNECQALQKAWQKECRTYAKLHTAWKRDYPQNHGFFCPQNLILLKEKQGELDTLLKEIEKAVGLEPQYYNPLEKTAIENLLARLKESQETYVQFYNKRQEFIVLGNEKTFQAIRVLGFKLKEQPTTDELLLFSHQFSQAIYETSLEILFNPSQQEFSEASIEKAYKTQMRKYHSDKHAGEAVPDCQVLNWSKDTPLDKCIFEETQFTSPVAFFKHSDGSCVYAIKSLGLIIPLGESYHQAGKEHLLSYHKEKYWDTCVTAIRESYDCVKKFRLGNIAFIEWNGQKKPLLSTPIEN